MISPFSKARLSWALAVLVFSLPSACIRPQNYHAGIPSTVAYQLDKKKLVAYEAYLEFDAHGQLFERQQLTRAVNMIQSLKHPASAPEQPVSLFVFIHGWKNNASEASGNVWGFRQILHDQAQAFQPEPVVGIYIGWPGDVTHFGKFFSFWNREGVADSIGGGDLDDVLTTLLTTTKGDGYTATGDVAASNAILIGHSMGALVLERSAIRLITRQLNKCPVAQSISPPADLIVLLNEAGPSSQAKPFLTDLLDHHVRYRSSGSDSDQPLLVAMTSDGDAATKIAFPGGEYISHDRPQTINFKDHPDVFGQTSSLPYDLLSPANFGALRSHEVVMTADAKRPCFVSTTVHNQTYCVAALNPTPPNTTPYWIMGIPQVFVPDHSSIFRSEMVQLVDALVGKQVRTQSNQRQPPLKLYKEQ